LLYLLKKNIVEKTIGEGMKNHLKIICIFLLMIITFGILSAQVKYKQPPKEIADIVTAPPTPRASLSPEGNYILFAEYEAMPGIAYLSQPLLRIAGMRITPNNNSSLVTAFNTAFTVKRIKDSKEIKIKAPVNGKFGSAVWSNDEKHIIFSQYTDKGVKLFIADPENGSTKLLVNGYLNMTMGQGYKWLKDNKTLLAFMVPENRGPAPKSNEAPQGPNVQETLGKVAPAPTYQDLLQNAHDEKCFDYYTTSQIITVNTITGEIKKLNKPSTYSSVSFSPNGEYILVSRIKRPYSYTVTAGSFPRSVELWNKNGEKIKELFDLPLEEEVPLNGVPITPRMITWRALEPACLVWVEALDGGDPEKNVPFRDKIMTLAVPSKSQPKEIMKLKNRFAGISWLEEKGLAFVSEYDWKKKWSTTYLFNFDKPESEAKVIFNLNTQDAYANPGNPVYKMTKDGEYVIIYENSSIYLSGAGSSPEGDRPFLDKMNINTMQKERLFRCKEKCYETFVDFIGGGSNSIVTRYESKTEAPNYFLLDLKTGDKKALTAFKDPAPQLTNIKKELIKYKRDDGVELSGTLYLPLNYKQGERLPLVLWAYPIEYGDAGTAGQVKGSQYRFTFFRGYSQLFYVTQGYALLDDAQMPVIGDPKTMNDTFIKQIVASAKAAIDKLDQMGIIDPKKVGVGGHSYGAFMTANLLAHCDLFAAGVARSGAYNRTLTPFGFQSERRSLWEAPQVYLNLSPFMYADKVKTPILLIHGEADNNTGTFPIQSQRFYQALKGNGAVARLVMLPSESHGYQAKESVLHVLAEMFEWFDKYVKNKK